MPPTNAEVATPVPYEEPSEADVERLGRRQVPILGIVEPKPEWAARFAAVAAEIRTALAGRAVAVEHVGSTAVPGLPAKDVLDVDLLVPDPADEAAYVPALEGLAFRFLLREPRWHEHRFFIREAPAPGEAGQAINLHVFGRDAAEPVRHRLFRDRLRAHPEDRDRYARAKRDALDATLGAGEGVPDYTLRKNAVVSDILELAFKENGLLPP